MFVGICVTLIIIAKRRGNVKAPPKFNLQFNCLLVNKWVMMVFPKPCNALESPGQLSKLSSPFSGTWGSLRVCISHKASGHANAVVWSPRFENHLVWGSWTLDLDLSQNLDLAVCFMCNLGQDTEAELLIQKKEHHYWIRLL